MTEEPLENVSSLRIRAGQGALILFLLTVREAVSFPVSLGFAHVATIVLLILLLAEAYLSLSRRSIFPDKYERRVNELLIGIAQNPVAWPVKAIVKIAEKRNENIRHQRTVVEAEQFLAEIDETVANDFGRDDWLSDAYDAESTAEKIVSRAEHNGPFAVKDVVAPEILSLPTDDRLIVTVLIIVRRQRATDGDIYEHKDAISQCLENFDFTHPSEAELKLLHGFDDLREILNSEDDTGRRVALETGVDDPEQAYEELMDAHYPFGKSYPEYDKTTLREYKKNIAELVQAELSVGGAQSRVLEAIREERERLKQELGSRDTFLLALRVINWDGSVDGYDDIDRPLARKFDDHIKIGRTYTVDDEAERDEDVRVNMWLVSVESRYPSGDAFYRSEVEPVLPDEIVGYATRIDTPLGPDYDRDELYKEAQNRELVDEIVAQADILFTGQQEEGITLRAIENMVDRDVSAEDLLAAIQLDSITGATAEESRVFSEHRSNIEDRLGIDSVFEWGNVSPERAGKEINALVDMGDRERWTELMSSLIDTVRRCRPPQQVAVS
ncbi:hypothetical protein [Haloarchaeobius litoreus]|uniref:Uncharacterized protein n=1 Tax=Haloarchaeobius litoreus TaxID=755306 RepID=A0ABD6DP01_9EURY|nr:hypothetical protein [Haloarchaeobius litoreus]